jgi:hypothetical protein
MTAYLIYVGVAFGFYAQTDRLRLSLFWPVTLGRIIAVAWEDRR